MGAEDLVAVPQLEARQLMRVFKLMFTNIRLSKPGFVNVRAQSHQHALDIAAVMGLEDAIVLFEVKATIQQKEIKQ